MTIREATGEDAEQIILHVQRIAQEPDIMIPLSPGEFQCTIEQEKKLLLSYKAADNSVFLVAEANQRVIGVLNCDGGALQATRHAASLGISVDKECRSQGTGRALMSHLIEWAKGTGIIRRLELEVYGRNVPAIHLYRQFGFVEEGQRHRAYFQNGQFIDSILMAHLM